MCVHRVVARVTKTPQKDLLDGDVHRLYLGQSDSLTNGTWGYSAAPFF